MHWLLSRHTIFNHAFFQAFVNNNVYTDKQLYRKISGRKSICQAWNVTNFVVHDVNCYMVKTIYQPVVAQEHTYKFQHETILVDMNQYMAKALCLLIVLVGDTIMYMCIWPLTWHNNHKLLQFINISSTISHLFIHRSKIKRSSKG